MIRRMIDQSEGSHEQRGRQHQMLRHVIQFCENKTDCRRVQVLAYFDEKFTRENCKRSCDNCKSDSTFETRNFTEYAAAAVRLVDRLKDDKVTVLHCVDVFRGGTSRKFNGYQSLEEYGIGSDLDRGDVERLFRMLLYEEAITEINTPNRRGFAVQYVTLGPKAQEYRNGRHKLMIPIRISPNGKSKGKPATRKPKANNGTGVRAAMEEFPQSTNVSSPIQDRSRRRADKRNNTYGSDLSDLSENEEDSDGFGPIREGGKPVQPRRKNVGPRITDDGSRAGLDQFRTMMLDDFLASAKQECDTV